jgi:hypothetical protein
MMKNEKDKPKAGEASKCAFTAETKGMLLCFLLLQFLYCSDDIAVKGLKSGEAKAFTWIYNKYFQKNCEKYLKICYKTEKRNIFISKCIFFRLQLSYLYKIFFRYQLFYFPLVLNNYKGLDNYSHTIKNDNLYVVDLDNGEKMDTLHMSFLFKSVKCIRLELTDNSLIGMTSKMLVYKNRIYILDAMKAKCLFVFDMEGSFIRKIGNSGPGPGEYADIKDFTIDTDNDEVIILDHGKNGMYFYDILDGTYKKTVTFGNTDIKMTIQYFDNNIYADAHEWREGFTDFLMQSINISTGVQETSYLKADEYNKGWNVFIKYLVNCFLPAIEPPYLFRQSFMDTIFSITLKGLSPYIAIKSEDFITEEDLRKPDNMDNMAFINTLDKKIKYSK